MYANRDIYEGDFIDSFRHGKGILITAAGDRYEGEFLNNAFNGYGIQTWATFEEDGEMFVGRRYEGEFKDNKKHGKGIFIYGNGDFYTGMFEKGLFHGYGTLKTSVGKFEGNWSRGNASGKMKISFTNGDTYEGEMLIGYFHGRGKRVYDEEKGYYDGEWSRDQMHGRGVRLYANGNYYEGSFFEGQIHGEGKMVFSNGDQYIGEWKDGHFEGKGVIVYASGDRYDGSFMRGVFYGEGTYKYADGGYYSGEYLNTKATSYMAVQFPHCDGFRHGFGTRLWVSGVKYEGQWRNNEMHGTGVLHLPDGTKYEGEFLHNVRHGFGSENYGNVVGEKFTCPMGRLHGGHGYCSYKGNWERGQYWGKGDFQCDDGRLYTGDWVAGKRHGQGLQTLLKKGDAGDEDRMFVGGNGSLYRIKDYDGSWVEDVRDGHGRMTYINGDSVEGMFVNGQPHGKLIYCFANSRRKRKVRYHGGYRVEWLDEVKKKTLDPFGAQRKPRTPTKI